MGKLISVNPVFFSKRETPQKIKTNKQKLKKHQHKKTEQPKQPGNTNQKTKYT